MNILLIGSGGRESAFAYKISQSALTDKLYIAPGNAGTAAFGENVDVSVNDFQKIADFALNNRVEMIVVGPEEPLVNGIHDFFLAHPQFKDIPVIGPQAAGARLEGSKDFSKEFMSRHGIPTAASRSFTNETLEEGLQYIDKQSLPVVLKADGLAAGKGVIISPSHDEARMAFKEMLSGQFGAAGDMVVIEDYLSGIELSVFVLTDGKSYKILPSAKDYKRIGEGDKGPNTGGMGSVSPVPFADPLFMQKVEERVIKPTIEGLKKDEIPYKGFLFIGLMNMGGDPYVIEYNVRMGDPETESIFPRIESDFVALLLGVAQENLESKELSVSPKIAATVMMVSGGYPGSYDKGKVMTGMENVKESILFHAGTASRNGEVVTNGGRVLAVTSLQDNLFDALQQATADAGRIFYDGRTFRRDIGFDLV